MCWLGKPEGAVQRWAEARSGRIKPQHREAASYASYRSRNAHGPVATGDRALAAAEDVTLNGLDAGWLSWDSEAERSIYTGVGGTREVLGRTAWALQPGGLSGAGNWVKAIISEVESTGQRLEECEEAERVKYDSEISVWSH